MIAIVKCQNSYWIGRTKSPERTLATIEDHCPFPVSLVHSYDVEQEAVMEGTIDGQFRMWKIHGRWFQLTPTDLAAVQSILAKNAKPQVTAQVLDIDRTRWRRTPRA